MAVLFATTVRRPVNSVAPVVSGDTGVGDTLSVTTGTWSNSPHLYRYQWKNGGVDISGATSSTLDTTGLEVADTITCQVTARNQAGEVSAISNSVILTGGGNASIESATINSAGDTLTVVLTGTDTITDATGWSVVFNNSAERVLTYSSGTGTDTFVFAISANPDYTAEGTDNDAAPVGTVCTLNYDADTGNVGTLEDVGGFEVTNNSTAHPEPDLPGNLPDTTLPTGWDGTADYTPADMAALNALTDDGSINGTAEDWTIVELDGTYTGQWVIDAAVEYVIFRCADHALLPAHGTRITGSDEANLATITRTVSATGHYTLVVEKGSSTHGARHIRFVGLKIEATGTYASLINVISIGQINATTDTTECPQGIGFNHCLIHCADATEVQEAMRIDATDSYVVDSRFTNLDAGGNDGSTGIRFYVGARLVFDNLFIESESAAVFVGGNETNRCEDIYIGNIQSTRPEEWDDANGIQKAPGIEIKTCLRGLIENVYVENGTWMQGGFGAITVKAGEPSGSVVDKWARHVTVRNCDISNCVVGIIVHESGSSGSGQGPNWDMLVENCVVRGTTGSHSAYIIPSDQGEAANGDLDRVIFRHNSFDKSTFCSLTTAGKYFIFKDNITTNFAGNAVGTGGVCLEAIWDSTYDFQYNCLPGGFVSQYDNYGSITGVLDNNLFPADSSTVGYSTHPPTELSHLEITDGVCNNAGSDGTDIGADIAGLVTIMSGVVE